MKVDVESAELDVIEGLGPLAGGLDAAIIELHPGIIPADRRPAYQQRVAEALGAIPLRWRYLVNEPPLVDVLPPDPWPARFHAFGTRGDRRTSNY
jgi:hypothetical protein